jgi:hypothetical protein
MNSRIGENLLMKTRERQNINLMGLSEQFLELVSIFKEESRNFTLIFLVNKAG